MDSYAFDDPRFAILAAAVRHLKDDDHARGKCLRIWHQCASRSTDRLRPIELAHCLGYRKPLETGKDAVVAFCDIAGLGERAGAEVRIKGTAGRTDYVARTAETLEDRIISHLSEHGPSRRVDVKRALDINSKGKSTFYAVIDRCLKEGRLRDSNGRLSVSTESSMDVQPESPLDVHGIPETSSGQGSLDLDPAPDPENPPAGDIARPHVQVQQVSNRTSMDSPVDVQAETDKAQEARRDAAWRLANLHDKLGREVAKAHGKEWRSAGSAGPQCWAERLLNGATFEDCKHVLTVLAAEADEMARLGADNPLRYLRTPTSIGVWNKVIRVPDRDTAREQARGSPANPSQRNRGGMLGSTRPRLAKEFEDVATTTQ